MNRINLFTAIVITLLISSCSSNSGNSKKIFNKMNWIEGKWVSTDVPNYSEIWKRVNDTCYDGIAVSPVESDSLVEERPRIVRRNDSIYFISEIEEQTIEGLTQNFVMTSTSTDTLVFANNDKNYPNRITYKRMNDTIMKVDVERKSLEGPVKFEYTLKKKK
jgi:flagellar basal body P-ring protein FlgI